MSKEKDIDKLIADKLREKVNSIPTQEYVAGAWESFKNVNSAYTKKQRRTRNIRIYSYSAIGAAALLLVGLFLFNNYSQDFELSKFSFDKSTLSHSISVIEKPVVAVDGAVLTIEAPILATDKPLKNIIDRSLLAGQREALVLKEKEASALKEKEVAVLTKREAEAVNEALVLKEKEASALKEKEVAVLAKREAEAVNEAAAVNKAETVREALVLKEKEASALKEKERIFENGLVVANKKLLRFGVNVSPGFNSTSSSSGSTFNYSGGVSLDIAIAKNLQISTGLQIEHQNVDGEARKGVLEMVPGHIDAVLTNLDIPINITWHFFTDKSKSYYVSGGLSSLAYLNEKYTTTSYSHQIKANTVASSGNERLTTYKIENVESVKTTTASPSNSMDLAGRVNLIFGYEQRLSSKLNLHIEPFIKIPLSGLASENMRFTTGGVTFKISF